MGEQKDELECSEAVSPGALVGPLFKVVSLAVSGFYLLCFFHSSLGLS